MIEFLAYLYGKSSHPSQSKQLFFIRALASTLVKICHFNSSKNYFIILAHILQYITHHVFYSSIQYIKIIFN